MANLFHIAQYLSVALIAAWSATSEERGLGGIFGQADHCIPRQAGHGEDSVPIHHSTGYSVCNRLCTQRLRIT